MKDGIPGYGYNFLGLQRTTIAAAKPLPAGKSTIRFEFAYDGGGRGKGGSGVWIGRSTAQAAEEGVT